MWQNNVHPITLFTLFIASFALLAIGLGTELFLEQWHRQLNYESYSWNDDDLIAIIIFLGMGSVLLVGALGLWLHKNWARYLVQVGFILAGIAWLFFMGFTFQEFNDAPWFFLTGATACILGLIVGSLLFLNNREWVLPYFTDRNSTTPTHNVLDKDW